MTRFGRQMGDSNVPPRQGIGKLKVRSRTTKPFGLSPSAMGFVACFLVMIAQEY